MTRILGIAGLVALAGCAMPPVVSEFNGDSVTVQSQTAANGAEVTAEASRICATRGRIAEYASSRQIPNPQVMIPTYAHLFLCSSTTEPIVL